MTAVPDAWRHDALHGWINPAIDEKPHPSPAPRAEVEPRVVNALGVDVASYQGAPDWNAVAASGRSWCYIKAGEGTGTSYPTLDSQYQGAVAAGLNVGLYWYCDPSQSPIANADAFAAQINRLGAVAGHLPPCLDLETGTGNLAQWAQQFITELRAKTGCVRIMLYSGASFFQNAIGESWMDQNIALWIASWGTSPGSPSYLTPRVALHQYASGASVAGITGAVDLDLAIWPLSSIIPGVVTPPPAATPPITTPSDLTSTEDQALMEIRGQLAGSSTVGTWPGWPGWPGGTQRSLTMVDWLRNADVQNVSVLADVAALKAELDAIKAQLGTASPALTAADQQAIALAVVTMLTQRLAS
jgi:lysozyme